MLKTTLRALIVIAAGLQVPLAQATFSGKAFYYNVEGAPGTCGYTNTNTELVASVSPGDYAGGANCGRDIEVSANGASFVAKVVGECPGCGAHDLDLSPAAFEVLAPLSFGIVTPVSWDFI